MQQGEVANFGDSSIINNLETILFASMKLIICYIPHFVMLILACYNWNLCFVVKVTTWSLTGND